MGNGLSSKLQDHRAVREVVQQLDNESCEEIRLSSRSATDSHLIKIARRVRPGHASVVKRIWLSGQFGDAGVVAFADALRHLRNVERLTFVATDMRDRGVVALVNAVSGMAHLQQLALVAHDDLSDDAVVALADGLRALPELVVLGLGVRLDSKGAIALATRALPFMTSLRVLRLTRVHEISDAGKAALAREIWASRTRPYGLMSEWDFRYTSLGRDMSLRDELARQLPDMTLLERVGASNSEILYTIGQERPVDWAWFADEEDERDYMRAWLAEYHPVRVLHAARLFGFARDRPEVLDAYARDVLYHPSYEALEHLAPSDVRAMWQGGVEARLLTNHPMFATDVCAIIVQYVDPGWGGVKFDWARGRAV